MTQNAKNIQIKTKVKGEVVDLFIKTTAANVYTNRLSGETLKDKLNDLESKIEAAEVDSVETRFSEIEQRIDNIISNTDETGLNSLKEIADWIDENSEDIESIRSISSGLDEKIAEKIGSIPEGNTVKGYIDERLQNSASGGISFKLYNSVTEFENDESESNGYILLKDDPVNVSDTSGLFSAIAYNKDIVLQSDLELSEMPDLNNSKIYYNGYQIKLVSA